MSRELDLIIGTAKALPYWVWFAVPGFLIMLVSFTCHIFQFIRWSFRKTEKN